MSKQVQTQQQPDLQIRKWASKIRLLGGSPMGNSQHHKTQIMAALNQVEAGWTVMMLPREHDASKHTICA